MRRKALLSIMIAVLLCFLLSPSHASNGTSKKYYLKADFGYSNPLLTNLDDELEAQGSDGVESGYGFSVSLGRAFIEGKWAFEIYFALSFYPEFEYKNDYEEFTGNLSHNGFGAIFKRRFRADSKRFIPSLGAGFSYGITNLISGGGKLKGAEALAVLDFEIPIRGNISIIFNGTYTVGLSEDTFDNPFLENVEDDVVRDRNGDPLRDRYSSFEIKLGIQVWLKSPTEY